jgi:hypothetical protein
VDTPTPLAKLFLHQFKFVNGKVSVKSTLLPAVESSIKFCSLSSSTIDN